VYSAKLLDIVPISALIQMFTTLVFENSIIVFANTVCGDVVVPLRCSYWFDIE